jgi:putative hydrolase of the HAD superfamily
MRPTTLLLDLDGVLRIWPSEHAALERAHKLPAGSIGKTAFESTLLEQVITGRMTDEEWRTEIGSRLSTAFPSSRAVEAVTAWSTPAGAIHEEVLQLVISARERCRIGLVTNATDRLVRDLETLGLSRHLDFIVSSSDVGFAKPAREIFVRALAVAGAQPAEAVFVDDTAPNVAAADALGIRSHHFVSPAGLTAFLQSIGVATNGS